MPQFRFYLAAFVRLVPEEEHTLGLFLFGRTGGEYGLKGVGIVACGPRGGGGCHRSWSEVLNLFQAEVHPFGFHGERGHVFGCASRMAADEIRYQLLVHVRLVADAVEQTLEIVEELERRLSHQVEDVVGSVLGGD